MADPTPLPPSGPDPGGSPDPRGPDPNPPTPALDGPVEIPGDDSEDE